MSLKGLLLCPLGKMRMTVPCRAHTCTHIQCYDAMLYLQMNEKKPAWQCPVCDRPALFQDLFVDGLWLEILEQAPSKCEQVEFLEDGSWKPLGDGTDTRKAASSVDDDADAGAKRKRHGSSSSQQSQEQANASKKAKECDVITIDSDDDEDFTPAAAPPSQARQTPSAHQSRVEVLEELDDLARNVPFFGFNQVTICDVQEE